MVGETGESLLFDTSCGAQKEIAKRQSGTEANLGQCG